MARLLRNETFCPKIKSSETNDSGLGFYQIFRVRTTLERAWACGGGGTQDGRKAGTTHPAAYKFEGCRSDGRRDISLQNSPKVQFPIFIKENFENGNEATSTTEARPGSWCKTKVGGRKAHDVRRYEGRSSVGSASAPLFVSGSGRQDL